MNSQDCIPIHGALERMGAKRLLIRQGRLAECVSLLPTPCGGNLSRSKAAAADATGASLSGVPLSSSESLNLAARDAGSYRLLVRRAVVCSSSRMHPRSAGGELRFFFLCGSWRALRWYGVYGTHLHTLLGQRRQSLTLDSRDPPMLDEALPRWAASCSMQ